MTHGEELALLGSKAPHFSMAGSICLSTRICSINHTIEFRAPLAMSTSFGDGFPRHSSPMSRVGSVSAPKVAEIDIEISAAEADAGKKRLVERLKAHSENILGAAIRIAALRLGRKPRLWDGGMARPTQHALSEHTNQAQGRRPAKRIFGGQIDQTQLF